MVYVDLNPVRAWICEMPEASDFTSIQQRLQAYQKLPLIQIFRNIQGGMDDPCNCHGFVSDSIQNNIVIDRKDM